jgi:predicted dehydrogenase
MGGLAMPEATEFTRRRLKDPGARFGVSRLYDYANFDSIANDPEIDCVYIILPVGLHAEFAIRALKAGKHVLCEKQMAATSAQCEAMIAAAKAAKRQLGVADRIHFEPTNILAQQLIAGGELGDIRFVSADHGFNANPSYGPHKWRLEKTLAGGGSMFDIGIYGLNTSLMMLGQEPMTLSANYIYPKDDPRFREVEGGIEYRLRMPDGVSVAGSSSYSRSPYLSQQRYMGSKASLFMKPATTYDRNSHPRRQRPNARGRRRQPVDPVRRANRRLQPCRPRQHAAQDSR